MANPVPAGSDVSAGTYSPSPKRGNGSWNTATGGDAAEDPYPDS